ncbi:uncharacterized protein BCR38DRAFT_454051 [Pseudomassariella vexata]|uniref:Inactive metallocarboxypeptidase ECM14 n=1 Tax=Pseudomassariella vexata TaxID=1141098 RepID=A0A1Y2EIY5_9PEZI|nr:uncharacterized protein BCR38DRAFT_454051 [Pseudomassariella vexata]ORY71548.1 hypothetical protein BCR38DRAFT_454051 [Pseudomassariella vexata]
MRCSSRLFLLAALLLLRHQSSAAGLHQAAHHGTTSHASLWGQRRYEDQVVLRFNVSTVEHEAALRKAVDQMLLDVWDFTINYTDIRLPNRRIRPFLSLLPEPLRTEHSILIHDVARAVAATYPSTYKGDTEFESAMRERGITPKTVQWKSGRRRHDVDDLFFKDYQRLAVISTWMSLMDNMFRGRGLVQMFNVGQSYEGKAIPALRVGMRPAKPTKEPRKTILITGGLHAREWIGVSSVNFLAWSFISAYGDDDLATKILHEFDFVFVPVLNPDGYEYTWNVDRLWRKSRQRTSMHYCPGFDLDHAFGYQWDGSEHQSDPCSESYGGDEPFQAIEASQLAQWALNETTQNNVNFVAYVDLHSYSQQILWPYAYSCSASVPNLENMQEVAMSIAKYMRLVSGEHYTVSSACEGAVTSDSSVRRLEASGGSSIDYFFHDLGAKYSYQIKLRDTGSYGFLLPNDGIVPTGEEVFSAMKGFGDYLLGNNGIERSYPAAITPGQEEQHVMQQTWKA